MVEHKGALCLAPMCSRPSEGSLWGAGVCRRERPGTRRASPVSERTRCPKGQYPHLYIAVSKDSTTSIPKASLPSVGGPGMIVNPHHQDIHRDIYRQGFTETQRHNSQPYPHQAGANITFTSWGASCRLELCLVTALIPTQGPTHSRD